MNRRFTQDIYLLIPCAVFFLACASETESGSDDTDDTDSQTQRDTTIAEDTGTDTEDPTAVLFSRDHVLDIVIEMDSGHWDELRQQTRSIFDLIGANCQEAPPQSPFTYFSANITIDGAGVENVGIRKKGFYGSLSEEKPSLKIKFSEYDESQIFAGEERLTLNNSISDPSYIKQCLGYDVFSAAGIPAPRCNFANVTVNGVNLGLYVNVESVKKRFLRRHFSDDEGHLYEGALSDFRPGWEDTFQVKTNKNTPDRSDLRALTDVLEDSTHNIESQIGPLVDLDAFIRFWATEYLVMHVDGYARNTNNFYIYSTPATGRFQFIPWGIDAIMGDNMTLSWESSRPEGAAWVEGSLARSLYRNETYQAQYFETLEQLLDTIWVEDALQGKIDKFSTLIRPYVLSGESNGFEASVVVAKQFVSNRRQQIHDNMTVRPTYTSELRNSMCSASIGTIRATFETTWDTLDAAEPLEVGTATFELIINGEQISFVATTALSGINDEGTPAVRLVGAASETDVWLVEVAQINKLNFTENSIIPIDWVDSWGAVIRIDSSSGEDYELIGVIAEGTLTLDEAGMAAGDVVSGEITADIYEAFFSE